MSGHLKVAYYLPRFPRLSETFIMREILALRDLGMDVQVFSLLPALPTTIMHQQVQDLMPYVHYSPYLFSFKVIRAQFYFLFRTPLKYFLALYHVIWQTIFEPFTCVKALFLFPKSIYFARQLKEMNFDHIHAHFVWINGIAAQVAADLIGISYSIHAHAWDIFQRKSVCVQRQIYLATVAVTISEYHHQFLSKLCPQKNVKDIRVVHCGLDPLEFSPDHVSSEDSFVHILSIGRLLTKKGFEYLIDACALLAARGYSFRCSIIGEGPLSDTLQARIDKHNLQDRVSLIGAKNLTEILDIYHHSDIFALACIVTNFGDRDGIPVVLMEAMAMQVPVITTPVSGNPELVIDGKTGLMVPERDPEALALAIEKLIKDQDLRIQLGKQGRQAILDGFDIHNTSAQMADIFQKIHNS